MLFQQRSLTPRSVANALTWVVHGSEENNAVEMRALEYAGVDRRTAWNEALSLRVFTVNFAIAMSLDNVKKKEAVLDRFYKNLMSAFGENSEIWEILQSRLGAYSEAVKTLPTSVRASSVGKTFAALCGSAESAITIDIGSAIFDNNYKLVSESIIAINIVME